MRKLKVETIEGIKEEIVYNVNDFPYYSFYKEKTCFKYPNTYYNISSSFDIESTTIETEYNIINGKKVYKENPYGFMYHWQFCIKDKVVFGRTWEEFELFLKRLKRAMKLNKKRILVVYIHNLAYEFQFMKDFLDIENLFAKDKRKPMKVNVKGIEFRCSYFLSNMSLAKFCENSEDVKHYKLVDTYDYRKKRLPNTPLTEEELGYCYNDVRGLCECLDSMLKYDTIATLPLTNTGFVRREYRQAMKQNKKNHERFVNTALNTEQYTMLKKAFRGGNTHANRFLANVILDNVHSFDISSSYPSSMAIDLYPMGKFTECTIDSQEKLDYFCTEFCCVFEVEFYNIVLNKNEVIPYIDIAHCEKQSNIINDNGRVLSADMIKLTLTNIDLDIIRQTYTFEGFEIKKSMYAEKGKLPKELREKLMHFYTLKTQLKDIENKEYEYMKSKNRLNATFGMCVTDIANDEIIYNEDEMLWEEYKANLEEEIEKFYGSRNNFLSYQWGVFVTANARKRLQTMLNIVGRDVIYTDTDSIKFINDKHIKEFEDYNKILIEQAENNDIPAYVDRIEVKDGKEITKRFYLGTWDNDGNYKRFKTLGAKKYAYEKIRKDKKTGQEKKIFEVTVSGMGKKKGAERVGSIENFNIGTTFSDIGRTTSWYNDNKPHKITLDGCTFTTASNIGILDTTYTLGVTMEYFELIENNSIESFDI